MKKTIIAALAGTACLMSASAAGAQSLSSPPPMAKAMMPGMAPVATTTSAVIPADRVPIMGLDGPAFSAAASDANKFQIAAARVSLMRAQRSDVKSYAQRLMDESNTAQKTLIASLTNDQRKIAMPAMALSADRASMLKMLRKTPRASFDNLYLTQTATVQQRAWSVYKGYASDGADMSLKQVAGNGVPLIEQQIVQGSALLPTSLSSN